MWVKFEDMFGSHDIVRYAFGLEGNTSYQVYKTKNNITISHGQGASLFNINALDIDDDTIIFVFDMDRLPEDWGENYLKLDKFIETVEPLVDKCNDNNIKILFAPTVFCSETIMLHKLDPNTLDFSLTFSEKNTAKMHKAILVDKLTEEIPYSNNSPYYLVRGKGNTFFKIKQTKLFVDRGYSIQEMIDILNRNGFSRFNKPFFDWISSGDISKTESLLDYELVKKFVEEFEHTIVYCIERKSLGVLYNGKQYT